MFQEQYHELCMQPSSHYYCPHWGPETRARVTQPVSSAVGVHTQAVWLQSPGPNRYSHAGLSLHTRALTRKVVVESLNSHAAVMLLRREVLTFL